MVRYATATRRGLVFTLYSEGPLAAGTLLFLLFPTRPVFLVVGIIGSMLIGFPGALAFWSGRREFGPKAERGVKITFVAFAVLTLSLVFAFFEVSQVFPDTLRVTDLRAPWFFLGVALLADAVAMVSLLSPLVMDRQRRWVWAIYVIGAIAGALYFWHGKVIVDDLVARSGGEAFVPAEAASYARDFIVRVVRDWAIAVIALRLAFWPALYAAISNVADAEREAEATTAGPIFPPA